MQVCNCRKRLVEVIPAKGYGQPVIKSKGSHTFPTLHCECLHGVFNKDMKTYNCLCVISLSRLFHVCLFCDLDQGQIKLYDQLMQKSRDFQSVQTLFLPLYIAKLSLLIVYLLLVLTCLLFHYFLSLCIVGKGP